MSQPALRVLLWWFRGRVYDGYDCDYYDNDYYYLTTTILRATYHSLLITRYFLLTIYYILFAAY